MDTISPAPNSPRIQNMQLVQDYLQNSNHRHCKCPTIFEAHKNILFIIKVSISLSNQTIIQPPSQLC